MKTLYLIRHAQSAANSGAAAMPDRMIPLSETGLQQAERLAVLLPPSENLLVSQMQRTQQTAAPYAKRHALTPAVSPLLNEFSYLPFDLIRNLSAAERRPLSEDYWQRGNIHAQAAPECDSFALFAQRVRTFLTQAHTLPDGCICFGHGIWIAMAAWQCLGLSVTTPDDMRQFRRWQQQLPMPNTAVWQLQVSEDNSCHIAFSGMCAE